MSRLIEQLSTLREELAHTRGAARDRLLERLGLWSATCSSTRVEPSRLMS